MLIKKQKLICVFLFLVSPLLCNEKQDVCADLIIFSYDRPMQLYALLESLDAYVTGLHEVVVIYRSSNERYEKSYQQVYEYFSGIIPVKQKNPPHDFKELTIKVLYALSCDYIIFAVDDIIVKDVVDLAECISVLEQTNDYGFYLRLGKNLSYCYPLHSHQSVPMLKAVTEDIYEWKFRGSGADWNYPHTVDMTLYKKKIAMEYFETLAYTEPNTLESVWANCGRRQPIQDSCGLCFACSKTVNLPLNRVQTVYNNPCMNCYSAFQLLEKFENGLKIDITPLHKICNTSAHMPYMPTFIARQ